MLSRITDFEEKTHNELLNPWNVLFIRILAGQLH